MNRFNIFTRPPATTTTTPANPNIYDAESATDPYDDRTPLSPRFQPNIAEDDDDNDNDLEANRGGPSPAAAAATREMAERAGRPPSTRFLHRFRPAIPSFFSTTSNSAPNQQQQQQPLYGFSNFRPSSSHYSGDGLRGAPDTVLNLNLHPSLRPNGGGGMLGVESPKSPEFRIREGELNLPGTRLHLPDLERTWTQGSNGPPTGTRVAAPEPVVVHARRHGSRSGSSRSGSGNGSGEGDEEGGHRERRRRRRGERGERSERSGSGSGRSRRSGRSGSHRSRDEESRSERRARRERRRGTEGSSSSSRGSRTDGSRGSSSRRERRPPRHFLFCFPWIKSRRVRMQILRCFVSGMFLALTLSIYLSLSLTKQVTSNEFTILLILILLFVAIFFCHSIIRLCMLVVKARKREQMAQRGQVAPEMVGPAGYAVPREPIPVVLARDEEAAGIESEATKTGPPAYGVWRESVRVDPDRLYWMRNHRAPADEVSDLSSSSGSGSMASTVSSQSSARTPVPRPPSYSSDDGVSYVVDARPRSMAPRGNGPLPGRPHPSESGMSGSWV